VTKVAPDPRVGVGRAGGVYVPPFKLAAMRRAAAAAGAAADGEDAQKATWGELRKRINGVVNKVNIPNMKAILPDLFACNLVRGRGLLCRSLMKAQLASPGFTHIYAALAAVLNTKMPENGELLLKRVVVQFRRSYKRRDKVVAIALSRFIAHLVNYQVAHELLALQVLALLLETPTDDSVEVAVSFVTEVGQLLQVLSPQGLHAIFERLRAILHEGDIDKRVQYTIEGLFAIRKAKFKDYPSVHPALDLVDADDQITHEVSLDDEGLDRQELLDVFRVDPDYAKNGALWKEIKREILGESSSDDSDSESGSGGSSSDDESSSSSESEEDDGRGGGGGGGQTMQTMLVQDATEQDMMNLRRTIYLTIMSSLSFEECAHKLMQVDIREGQEIELCNMLIECCSQERTYLRYYGLLGARFCLVRREYQAAMDECFTTQYSTIHRLETNKLRNVAKFFAHMLFTDSLPWTVFEHLRLTEEDTTSSSRIFIKILLQEMAENLGLQKLKARFLDAEMRSVFGGMFPLENPRDTRFAINYFTSIGLGGLT